MTRVCVFFPKMLLQISIFNSDDNHRKWMFCFHLQFLTYKLEWSSKSPNIHPHPNVPIQMPSFNPLLIYIPSAFSPTPLHLSLWLFNTVSWFCYTFLDFRVLKLNSAEGCFSELLNNTIGLWPCAQRHSQHQLPSCSAAPTSSLLCLHHSQPASDNASAPHLVTKNSAVPSPFSYN